MPPITIRSPPSLDDYTPLTEHQSRTPESFFGGKPVLYHYATGVKAWIPESQRGLSGLPFFPADSAALAPAASPETAALNGAAEELLEQVVDLFVTSQSFTLFCPSAEAGISIPYPSISLHAIKHLGSSAAGTKLSAVYLQLELADSDPDDEAFDTSELTLVPPPPSETPTPSAQSETSKLFDAISACSNLHPDPAAEDDSDEDGAYADDRIVFEGDGAEGGQRVAIEGFDGVVFRGAADGGLPPPMPGSGGWITAENMHEFFDEDGNWIGSGGEADGEEEEGISGELGDGAGRVRRRDEAEGDAATAAAGSVGAANGHGATGDAESKRPRVE